MSGGSPLMENRVVIQVTNDSEHTFIFDGDWLRTGEFKSNRQQQIPAKSLTILEFQSTQAKGVAGVAWWVDAAEHDVYLSMAFANPRLQTSSFACWAGPPPQDLKSELDLAPKLVKGEEVISDGAGCAWVPAAVGNLTVIRLTLFAELARYVPVTAASLAAEAAKASTAEAEPGVEPSNGTEAAAEPGVATAVPADSAAPSPSSSSSAAPPATAALAVVGTGRPGEAGEPEMDGEAAREALNKIMAQTRPKDALDGLGSGLKTAGTSVVAGLGSIVASTVSGYQQGGLGLLKGLGTGIVSGAAIAIGGTACGVAQIGRGIANTPEAMRGRREQRVWDQELGQWVDIDLCAMEQQVEAEGSDDETAGESAASREVADSEYYDLLKVKPNATPSDIKKAYYKEAKQCHPDKNPDDLEAKAKFQKLADAYQVLSNPQLREKYDREGKEGIQEGNAKMDASVFFSLLFGSERFEPWTGELHLAMQTDQFAKSLERGEMEEWSPEDTIQEGEVAAKSLKRRQLRREVRCACHLRSKLERLVSGRDPEGWEEQMRLEAVDLANGQFGPELLSTLGEIYQLRAEIYLADELIGRFSFTKRVVSIKHSSLTMRHRLHLYQNAAGSLLRMKRVHDAAKTAGGVSPPTPAAEGEAEERPEDEQQRKAIEDAFTDALPVFLQTAWAAVVTDIDGTIKEVGRKLLKDKSVPWQIRIRRAQALQRLGQIFTEEGAKAVATQGNTTSRFMNSEVARATLQEALVGSVRDKR